MLSAGQPIAETCLVVLPVDESPELIESLPPVKAEAREFSVCVFLEFASVRSEVKARLRQTGTSSADGNRITQCQCQHASCAESLGILFQNTFATDHLKNYELPIPWKAKQIRLEVAL